LNEYVLFLGRLLRQPAQMGAVAPSSAALAAVITSGIGLERARVVVELGAGTGVFTGAIGEKAPDDAHILAVEVDRALARAVRRLFPEVQVVHGPAEQLTEYVDDPTGPSVDCIVSGLPWAAFGAARQVAILDAARAVLRPGGWFTTFTYVHAAALPSGRRFRRLLESRFASIVRTPVVWRNLPPAFVYRCQR
jgi:phosphatidylethanolamine/phosphatidyl-N-methylethanolamine N-methyltransferase